MTCDLRFVPAAVEEEIFRNFVMQHLIDVAKLPLLDKVSENDIPSSLKPLMKHKDSEHWKREQKNGQFFKESKQNVFSEGQKICTWHPREHL